MTIVAAILTAALSASAPTQTAQTQPPIPQPAPVPRPITRDAPPPAVKGTSVLRGRVSNPEGRPLRRVQIRLNGEGIGEGRTASTNGLGKWEIRDLPKGRFTMSAARAGYLTAQHGQKRYGEPGRAIDVGDGDTIENLDLTLTKGAVITGHILDEAGEPLPGATVMPMQTRFFNGRKRLAPVRGNTISDDSGQYRIGALEPGEYYIYAASRETWESDPPDVKTMGFLPTMYPAAPGLTEAQRVRVRPGQEATGIDIALVPGKAGSVSGTVVSSQGSPLGGESISLGVEIRGENFSSFFGGASARINPDGGFVFRNVAPGEYHLTVRVTATDRPVEAANVIVNVTGDLEGVSVITSVAGSISGRVVTDPGATLPTALTRLTVRALPVDRDTQVSLGSVPDNGRVREDGTFDVKGIVGPSRLTIATLPEGWAIRQIDYGARDVAVQPFDPPSQANDVMVFVTNRFPTLTATLHDDKGAGSTDGMFILFPDDNALWAEDARLVRAGRPAPSGAVVVRGVRPGVYLAAAVPSIGPNQWFDPEVLESLRAQAKRITLVENVPAKVDVVVKAPGG